MIFARAPGLRKPTRDYGGEGHRLNTCCCLEILRATAEPHFNVVHMPMFPERELSGPWLHDIGTLLTFGMLQAFRLLAQLKKGHQLRLHMDLLLGTGRMTLL